MLERFFDLEAHYQLPRWRYVALSRRATLATLQGRFEEATRWIAEASALGERLGEADRHGVRCDQTWELARLQGDDDTTAALLAGYRDDPHIIVLEVGDAYERGDLARAEQLRATFDELAAQWPRWAATVWLTLQVQLAVATADRERCERLRSEVAPLADQWAVLGGGVLTRGPMVLWRAALDAGLDEWDEAIAGFVAATASAEALHARPWVVQARLGLAQALLARAGPGDTTKAAELLDLARREAATLGMRRVRDDADRMATTMLTGAGSRHEGEFVLDGDVWTISFDGVTIRMPDAKGLHDIRTLIRVPGREVPAVELLDPSVTPEVIAAHRHGADPILDDMARDAYRRRLDELDTAIKGALTRHDDAGAQRLDAERDGLIAELRLATGLGGRSRRLGDESERARKTVTARIRNALSRLDERHPTLAEHLHDSLTTGATCRYQPHELAHWRT